MSERLCCSVSPAVLCFVKSSLISVGFTASVGAGFAVLASVALICSPWLYTRELPLRSTQHGMVGDVRVGFKLSRQNNKPNV